MVRESTLKKPMRAGTLRKVVKPKPAKVPDADRPSR